MSEYFIPTFRRQIGDPTTDRDPFICTMTSGAMVLDYHTQGRIKVWGGQLEKCQDDHVGGTGLDDLQTAWKRCHDQTLEIRTGRGWAGVKAALAEGRAVVLQGDYDQIVRPYSCQASFLGDHAIALLPSTSSWARVGDPLCRSFTTWPEMMVKAYAIKLDPGVRFAVSAAHGPIEESDEMFPEVNIYPFADGARTWHVKAGTTLSGYDPAQPGKAVKTAIWSKDSQALCDAKVYVAWVDVPQGQVAPIPKGGPFLRCTNGAYAGLLIVESQVTLDPAPPPTEPADCSAVEAELKAARDELAVTEGLLTAEKAHSEALEVDNNKQKARIATMKGKTAAYAADIADD